MHPVKKGLNFLRTHAAQEVPRSKCAELHLLNTFRDTRSYTKLTEVDELGSASMKNTRKREADRRPYVQVVRIESQLTDIVGFIIINCVIACGVRQAVESQNIIPDDIDICHKLLLHRLRLAGGMMVLCGALRKATQSRNPIPDLNAAVRPNMGIGGITPTMKLKTAA